MHRILDYDGTINGSELRARYVLQGERRQSFGDICVEISSNGKTMKGTFTGTAANAAGTVEGFKME